jgi:hypothetical protein
MREISSLAKELLGLQEERCSMELFILKKTNSVSNVTNCFIAFYEIMIGLGIL